jgi:hypothetical protein
MGARSMRDAVENFMGQPMAQWLLSHPTVPEGTVLAFSAPPQTIELVISMLDMTAESRIFGHAQSQSRH